MGALKINVVQPVIMEHELEKGSDSVPLGSNQHVVWDDNENLVYDIGSEVEELYKDGQLVNPVKQSPDSRTGSSFRRKQSTGNTMIVKKKPVGRDDKMRAIRED